MKNSVLTKLDLYHNHMTHKGLETLCKGLAKATHLMSLDLGYNPTNHHAVSGKLVCNLLERTMLSSLFLDNTQIRNVNAEIKCSEKRWNHVLAFLMGSHSRLGEVSPVQRLNIELVEAIATYLPYSSDFHVRGQTHP